MAITVYTAASAILKKWRNLYTKRLSAFHFTSLHFVVQARGAWVSDSWARKGRAYAAWARLPKLLHQLLLIILRLTSCLASPASERTAVLA